MDILDTEQLILNILKPKFLKGNIDDLNIGLKGAVMNEQLFLIQYLLTSPELCVHANINFNENILIKTALENNKFNSLKYLLTSQDLFSHCEINILNSLSYAEIVCRTGNREVFEYLTTSKELPQTLIIDKNMNGLLDIACISGNLEIVRFLLTSNKLNVNADIKSLRKDQIITYYYNEGSDIIRYLLNASELTQHVDPHLGDDILIQQFVLEEDLEMLKFIIFEKNINITPKIMELISTDNNEYVKKMFDTREFSQHLKAQLSENTNENCITNGSKKLKI